MGPSGNASELDNNGRATAVMQVKEAVSWCGSVKVSRAVYVLEKVDSISINNYRLLALDFYAVISEIRGQTWNIQQKN